MYNMFVFIYVSEHVRYAAVVAWISYFMTARVVQLTGCACCLGAGTGMEFLPSAACSSPGHWGDTFSHDLTKSGLIRIRGGSGE